MARYVTGARPAPPDIRVWPLSISSGPTDMLLERDDLPLDPIVRSPEFVPWPLLCRHPQSMEPQLNTASGRAALRCCAAPIAQQPQKPALLSAPGKNCDFAPLLRHKSGRATAHNRRFPGTTVRQPRHT